MIAHYCPIRARRTKNDDPLVSSAHMAALEVQPESVCSRSKCFGTSGV
jgi:hypothetical protein